MFQMTILALLIASMVSHAQKMPLEPGKPFPYQDKMKLEGSGEELTINDFKGKYVLVDLFGRYCVACFSNLPKLDSFQKEFGNSLQILLIGKNDEKLPGIYEKFRKRFNIKLPVVMDSIPFKWVRHFFLPTYVWIDPNGLMTAISGPDKITRENISNFVSGRVLPFGELIRPLPFDTTKDLLASQNGGADTSYLVRTIFSKWNPTQPIYYSGKLDFSKESRKFFMLGFNMKKLYTLAEYGVPNMRFGDSLYNIVFEEPEILGPITSFPEERYNFAVSYNGENPPVIKDLLVNTLEQYFGFKSKVERRLRPYYRVTIDPSRRDLLKSKGGPPKRHGNHVYIDYKNVEMSYLVNKIRYYSHLVNKWPVIDESGIEFNIDINVEAVMTDLSELFAELRKKGVIIEEGLREMEVITLIPIKDNF